MCVCVCVCVYNKAISSPYIKGPKGNTSERFDIPVSYIILQNLKRKHV